MTHEDPVTFAITQGEPYTLAATITNGAVEYPSGVTVAGQIRKSAHNRLWLDITDRLSTSVSGSDLVLTLELTGADTRQVRAGVYDIFIFDAGDEDQSRAVRILHGPVTVEYAVTKDTIG